MIPPPSSSTASAALDGGPGLPLRHFPRSLSLFCALLSACATSSPDVSSRVSTPVADLDIPVLRPVQNWAMQLQELETDAARGRLADARVDMLVLEPMRSQRGLASFDAAAMVRDLQRSEGATLPNKRVLAYLNVGQAEDYRGYWRDDWRAPTATTAGNPSFLLTVDPDGWQGNYPVAFWRPEWRRQLFGNPAALLDQIVADGFDGAYVDWVLAYAEPAVVAAAARDGVDPASAMVDLLAELRRYARSRYPLFVLVAQNAVDLAERHPHLLENVDALAQEDVCFRGAAGAAWHDPAAGDAPAPTHGDWSTDSLCRRLCAVRAAGVPVFTLDYALDQTHRDLAERTSRSNGFVPYVSRTPLDRLAQPSAPPH